MWLIIVPLHCCGAGLITKRIRIPETLWRAFLRPSLQSFAAKLILTVMGYKFSFFLDNISWHGQQLKPYWNAFRKVSDFYPRQFGKVPEHSIARWLQLEGKWMTAIDQPCGLSMGLIQAAQTTPLALHSDTLLWAKSFYLLETKSVT